MTLIATVAYFGPRSEFEPVSTGLATLSVDLRGIDGYLRQRESSVPHLKPDNEARIVWHTPGEQTACSVVYIHGFSASQGEALPLHREFSTRYGCNLYLHRLPGHGVAHDDAFAGLTPRLLVDSAKEAIAIGQLIGRRVILMSSSSGSTLSMFLARNNPSVAGLIMYSPNIELRSRAVRILTLPWGLQIGRLVYRGNYREFAAPPGAEKYWTTRYRLEGLAALERLLAWTMTDDVLASIEMPFFAGYYYRDAQSFDDTVSIDAMRRLVRLSRTPPAAKRFVAFPKAGTHIISSPLWAAGIDDVRQETFAFAEDVLKLRPIEP